MNHENIRRASDCKLEVDIVLIDLGSGAQIRGRARDFDRLGCRVSTTTSFSKGTMVMLRVTYGSQKIVVTGKVMHYREDIGMGIVFTSVEPEDLEVIENWMAKASLQA